MLETNHQSQPNYKLWSILAWSVILVGALHSLISQTHYFLNADVAFLTQMALYGQPGDLYTQYFEINPPLIVYIYRLFLVPYYLGDWSVVSSLRISMIGYLLGITVLCHYYVVKLPIRQPYIWIAAIGLSLVFVLPAAFLQREHIIAAAMIAYLCMILCRMQNQSCSVAIQWLTLTLAGLSVCLKPQYVTVFVLLDIYYLWTARRLSLLFRWQNLYLGLLGATYITYVYFAHPSYFDNVAPLAKQTYIAYFEPIYSLLTRVVLLAVVSYLPYRYLRHVTQSPQTIDCLYVTLAAAFVAYVLGRAGFSYHLVLVFALLGIVSISSWLYAASTLSQRFSIKHLVQFLFFSAILVFLRQFHFIDIDRVNYETAATQLLAKHSYAPEKVIEHNPYHVVYNAVSEVTQPGEQLYAFSARLFVGQPITIHLEQKWAGRFPVLWPLPESLKHPESEDSQQRLQLVSQIVTEDILRNQPKVILVEESEQLLRYPKGFDFIEHFSQYPEFADAFQHYERDNTFTTPESNWTVYVRREKS